MQRVDILRQLYVKIVHPAAVHRECTAQVRQTKVHTLAARENGPILNRINSPSSNTRHACSSAPRENPHPPAETSPSPVLGVTPRAHLPSKFPFWHYAIQPSYFQADIACKVSNFSNTYLTSAAKERSTVKRVLIAAVATLCVSPLWASTHKFNYEMPCTALWPAVKDTLRNSGKYGIIGIDSSEMTSSYNIGGNLTGKRINSLVLNTIPTGCELQVQTAYSGLVNNDAGDLKKRVDESVAKLALTAPAAPASAPATTPPPAKEQAVPAPK